MLESISPHPPDYAYGMPVHPVCDLLPLMDSASLHDLADSIREHGLLAAIVVHNGQLIDGRNRILACQQAQIEPKSVEWRDIYKGELTVARWIEALNEKRRHMSDDQRVAFEIILRGWEEREAAQIRQMAAGSDQGVHGKEGGRGHKKPLCGGFVTRGFGEETRATCSYSDRQAHQRLGAQGPAGSECAEGTTGITQGSSAG